MMLQRHVGSAHFCGAHHGHRAATVCWTTARVPATLSRAVADEQLSAQAGTEMPVPVRGPVTIVPSPGRGRGLGLSGEQPGQPGDLLLVSVPISVVYGEGPEPPAGVTGVQAGVGSDSSEIDEDEDDLSEGEAGYEARLETLADLMEEQRYTPTQVRWLEALSASPSDMSSGDGKASQQPSTSGPQTATDIALTDLEPDHRKGQKNKSVPLPSHLAQDREKLRTLLQRNTFELLGLWPEYSLLNHSCVPSTVSYVHNLALITRVTRRNVSQGAELYTNYLGNLVMAPLDVRRAALQEGWGFQCMCARCREESTLDKDLLQLVKDIHEACVDQINDDLIEAVMEEDREALASIQEQTAAYVEVVWAALTRKKLSDRTRVWLQAGLFNLYEALYHCLEAQDLRDLGLTHKLQELSGAIQPGSDSHLQWAVTYRDAVQEAEDSGQLADAAAAAEDTPGQRGGRTGRKGGGAGFGGAGSGKGQAAAAPAAVEHTVEAADALCYKAFCTRYGPLSRERYAEVLDIHRGVDEESYDEDELE